MTLESRWFAAETKRGKNRVALDNLKRQGLQAYAPLVVVEQLRKGRIRETKEPLFPNYVLIRFQLSVASWRSINSTRGIKRLVSFALDGTPTPLPVGEIERLQQREKAGELRISEITTIKIGDQVRMTVGSATDQIGEVVRTRGERVELLLSLLGGKVRCIAPLHTLQLVGRNSPTGSAVAISK